MAGTQLSSTHPPHPLPSEEDIVTCLRLLRSRRVGPATYRPMIREHGSASAALAALPDVAASAGVTDYQICPTGVVMAELKTARSNNARLLVQGTPYFPAALDDLDDAPPLLWSIGDTSLLARPVIAMVGARNASSLGTCMAKKLAADLGDAGYVIVSGLARGVYTAAHLASLTTGTIPVQAGGVDVIYPTENTALTQDIAKSGLSMGVVVIEAAAKSCSLITARNALDQSRDVLAVPGHPFDGRTAGCNMLIRDGATLVSSADDVIEALGHRHPPQFPELPLPTPAPKQNLRQTADLHSKILQRLGPSPVAADQTAARRAFVAFRLTPHIRKDAYPAHFPL